MSARTASIDSYLTRLRQLSEESDDVQRFFLFLDGELYEIESELADSEQAGEFYDALTDQYRAWRDEMGEERWQEVLAYNDSLNGANRNWMLDEI